MMFRLVVMFHGSSRLSVFRFVVAFLFISALLVFRFVVAFLVPFSLSVFRFVVAFLIISDLLVFRCVVAGEGRVVRRCWVNFQCRTDLLIWIIVGQGPTVLAVGADGGCLDIFFSRLSFLFLLPVLEDGPI